MPIEFDVYVDPPKLDVVELGLLELNPIHLDMLSKKKKIVGQRLKYTKCEMYQVKAGDLTLLHLTEKNEF
jgi:hypothetical protein